MITEEENNMPEDDMAADIDDSPKKNEPKKSERTKLVEFIKKANKRLELKNKKGSSSDRKRKMSLKKV